MWSCTTITYDDLPGDFAVRHSAVNQTYQAAVAAVAAAAHYSAACSSYQVNGPVEGLLARLGGFLLKALLLLRAAGSSSLATIQDNEISRP